MVIIGEDSESLLNKTLTAATAITRKTTLPRMRYVDTCFLFSFFILFAQPAVGLRVELRLYLQLRLPRRDLELPVIYVVRGIVFVGDRLH